MAKSIYASANGLAQKVKKMYVGIEGVARKVKKGYVGVNGLARLFFTLGTMFRFVTSFRIKNPSRYGIASHRYQGGKVGDYYIHFTNDSTSTFMVNGHTRGGEAIDMLDYSEVDLGVYPGNISFRTDVVSLNHSAVVSNLRKSYNDTSSYLCIYDEELTRSDVQTIGFECNGAAPLGNIAMFYDGDTINPDVYMVTEEGTVETSKLVPGYLYGKECVDQFGKYNVVSMIPERGGDGWKIYSISEELVVEEIYDDVENTGTDGTVYATRTHVFTKAPWTYADGNGKLHVFDDEFSYIGTTQLISKSQYYRRYIPMGSQLVAMGGIGPDETDIPYLDYIDEELVPVFQDSNFVDQFSPNYGDMGFGKYGEDKVCVHYGRNTDSSAYSYGTTFAVYENV